MEIMTQGQIQSMHNYTMRLLEMYASGLITLPELVESMGESGKTLASRNISGLIDPASGLRLS